MPFIAQSGLCLARAHVKNNPIKLVTSLLQSVRESLHASAYESFSPHY